LTVDEAWVSAMTFWEIAMLVGKRRIKVGLPLQRWRRDFLAQGLLEIPVTGAIGIAAAELDEFHADPSDRIIIATAREVGATLLTGDRQILAWQGDLQRQDARR
jgi:PIN domain nuclease of toxin-antitoxin system